MLQSVNQMSKKALQDEFVSYGGSPDGMSRDALRTQVMERRETQTPASLSPGRPSHLYLNANARVYHGVSFYAAHKEKLQRVGDYIDVDGHGNCLFG